MEIVLATRWFLAVARFLASEHLGQDRGENVRCENEFEFSPGFSCLAHCATRMYGGVTRKSSLGRFVLRYCYLRAGDYQDCVMTFERTLLVRPQRLLWVIALIGVIGTGCQTFTLTPEEFERQQHGQMADSSVGGLVGTVGSAAYFGAALGAVVGGVK